MPSSGHDWPAPIQPAWMKGHTQLAESGSNESETHQNALDRTEVDGGEAIRCGRVAFTLSVQLWPRIGLNLYRPVRPFDADSPLSPHVAGWRGGIADLVNNISPWLDCADCGQDRLESIDDDGLLSESGDYVHGVCSRKGLPRPAEWKSTAAHVRGATPTRFSHPFGGPNPSPNCDFRRSIAHPRRCSTNEDRLA
jgi:hypothetical protein